MYNTSRPAGSASPTIGSDNKYVCRMVVGKMYAGRVHTRTVKEWYVNGRMLTTHSSAHSKGADIRSAQRLRFSRSAHTSCPRTVSITFSRTLIAVAPPPSHSAIAWKRQAPSPVWGITYQFCFSKKRLSTITYHAGERGRGGSALDGSDADRGPVRGNSARFGEGINDAPGSLS